MPSIVDNLMMSDTLQLTDHYLTTSQGLLLLFIKESNIDRLGPRPTCKAYTWTKAYH